MISLISQRHRLVCALVFSVFAATACGGSPSTPPDGDVPDAADSAPDGAADGAAACSTDSDCDDGVFCNGVETCEPDATAVDVCVPSASPCSAEASCDESTDSCETEICDTSDADGDGFDSVICGGTDCDDADSARFPGNAEICDAANHDEDCDPMTFGIRDADGDGSPDARCCNEDGDGGSFCGDDCDDTRAGVNTDNPEVCNGRDDDCDGLIDEGVLATLYLDDDGDGFGDATMSMEACVGTVVGYVEMGTDCDDSTGSVNPGAVDICDAEMVDQDCNGTPNDPPGGCTCITGVSRGCLQSGICSAGTELCVSGMWAACSITPEAFEICDGEDDDCNGTIDDGLRRPCWPDGDLDGFALDSAVPADECMTPSGGCPSGFTPVAPLGSDADCDDGSATRSPGTTEVCNGVDDNCDGVIDEALTLVCYADEDNDTFASSGTPAENRCPVSGRDAVGGCPSAFTNRPPTSLATTDCNDDSSAGGFSINPGITEVCDSVDNNCNGATDEGLLVTLYHDVDGDGFGDPSMSMMACPGSLSGWVPSSNDCNDGNPAINPSATDICDMAMVDEDCSGTPNDPPGGCACTMGMSEGCPQPGICAAGTRSCISGTWSACSITPEPVEVCDGEDDDCNGVVDDGLLLDCWVDGDNDGFALAAASMSRECRTGTGGCPASFTSIDPVVTVDCNDASPMVFPGASESPCNGVDNDCDGMVDEGLTVTCYVDDDDDSYSPMGATAAQHCPDEGRGLRGGCPLGFTNRAPAGAEDCADDIFIINPGVPEICEDPATTDENCDGLINPMSDCDCGIGMTRACELPGVCASGTETCVAGSWGACTIVPTAEVCNGLDDNCNGDTDEVAGGVCALGDPAIPCTTACGLGGTAGEQTCLNCLTYNTCRSADEGDGFAGSCNACDDDGDGSIDEGFTCARGVSRTCTNSCGNPGNQICNTSCSGWGLCVGDEVCDYCDDDGDGLADDRGLAESTYFNRFRSGSLTGIFGSAGPASTQTELHDRDVVNSVGAVYLEPYTLGYGEITIEVRTTSQQNPCGAAMSGGWAFVMFSNLTDNNIGGNNEFGVPRSNEGISVEWSHNSGAADTARMWRLSLWGAIARPVNNVLPSLASGGGSCTQTQRMDITITPDNPDTASVNETSVLARDGVGNFIGSCTGSDCGTELKVGNEVMIGVTGAATNGRQMTHILSGITSDITQTQICL